MYNEDDYENYENDDENNEEEEEQSSGSKIKDIYYNNKKLIWVLGIIILLIIIISIFNNKGGSGGNSVFAPVNKEERVQVSKSKDLQVMIRGQKYSGSTNGIKWESTNKEIVDVDNSGRITGNSIGNTTVIGMYTENNKTYKSTISVIVFDGDQNVKLKNADYGDRSLVTNTVIPGFPIGNQLSVTPDNAYVYNIKYTSSNKSIVSVDEAGVVHGISNGNATITASINDDSIEAKLNVYVMNDAVNAELIKIPQKIDFVDGKSLKLPPGELKELKLDLSPSDSSTSYITWKSSDESVVTVASDGTISCLKEGSATITAKALNGQEGKIAIDVDSSVADIDSISIIPSSITLKEGESHQLIPTVKPDNASNKALIFETSNSSVASVVATSSKTSATVYAGNKGNAVITVKSPDGKKSATLTVKVTESGGGTTGGGNNPTASSDGTLIKVRLSNSDSKDQSPNKKCSGTITYFKGPLTVTISDVDGVDSVAYCYTKGCTPNKNDRKKIKGSSVSFDIPNGGTYILKVRKYDSKGNEITKVGSGNNYEDGSFVYFINTKQSGLSCTSKSSWESGGSTAVSKGACYVNSSSQGVGTNFVWKETGDSLSVGTSLVETIITNSTDCEKARSAQCFHVNINGKWVDKWGSIYAVKSGYDGRSIYVPSKKTEKECESSSSTSETFYFQLFKEKGGEFLSNGSIIPIELNKTVSFYVEMKTTSANERLSITSGKTGVVQISPNSISSSGTVNLKGIKEDSTEIIVSDGTLTKRFQVIVEDSSKSNSSSGKATTTKETPTITVTPSINVKLGQCNGEIVARASVPGAFYVETNNSNYVDIDGLPSVAISTDSENKVKVKVCGNVSTGAFSSYIKFIFRPKDENKYNAPTEQRCKVTVQQ